jgi:hypothetical protein
VGGRRLGIEGRGIGRGLEQEPGVLVEAGRKSWDAQPHSRVSEAVELILFMYSKGVELASAPGGVMSLLVTIVVMCVTQKEGGANSPLGGVKEGVRDSTGTKGSKGGHEKGAFRFPHPESAEVNAREKARRWYRIWEKVHRPQVSARKIGRLQCRRLMSVARKLGGAWEVLGFCDKESPAVGRLTNL